MRTLRPWLGLLGLALASLPASAPAQPVGEEFQINTYTNGSQTVGRRAVAADASGNFVVVWDGPGLDGSGDGIVGQRYDSAGDPLGGEFVINSYTTANQRGPSVGASPEGAFVVVWQRDDGDGDGVFGQRFDSAGQAQGGEFQVNTFTTRFQGPAEVALDASGNFVVVWRSVFQDSGSPGVFGQRYDSAGGRLGSEFRVNSYVTSVQKYPAVASDPSGNFVVAWESNSQDGSYEGVFAQRFDSGGTRLGAEFRVNSYTPRGQRRPSVASDAQGNFVVVWETDQEPGIFPQGISGQRYDNAGQPQGGEFRVNSYTPESQTDPSVSSDTSGNFVVTWESHEQDGDATGVFGQRYDAQGVAQGGEFQVNTYTTDVQEEPSVAATGTNEFIVTWESGSVLGGNTDIFGQRFSFGGDSITVVSPNSEVKWRIGSLQKIQWTHTLGLDATFRIELDRDDDGDYEELIAAAAPVDGATKGRFAWTVTGPPSGTARVRVSWTDDLSVFDVSDVTFQIRPAASDSSGGTLRNPGESRDQAGT